MMKNFLNKTMSSIEDLFLEVSIFITKDGQNKFVNILRRILRIVYYPLFVIYWIAYYLIVGLSYVFPWFIIIPLELLLIVFYTIFWIITGKNRFFALSMGYNDLMEGTLPYRFING